MAIPAGFRARDGQTLIESVLYLERPLVRLLEDHSTEQRTGQLQRRLGRCLDPQERLLWLDLSDLGTVTMMGASHQHDGSGGAKIWA